MFVVTLKKLWEYASFRVNSKPKGGFGIHSPFVFDLYTNVLEAKTKPEFFDGIDNVRKELRGSDDIVIRVDYGSGAKVLQKAAKIGSIARLSSVPKYLGEMLYRMVNHYKPESILELGTSIGLSTLYLAAGNSSAKVFTVEGDKNLSDVAKGYATNLGLTNINFCVGEFSELLPEVLDKIKSVDFIFVDGDHNEESTMMYFNMMKKKSTEKTIMVFDDIRWSDGMRNAWGRICNDADVTVTVDLFRCGIVFFRKGIVKQHFNLRFGPF